MGDRWPHYIGEADELWDARDLEREQYAQAVEDATASPTYAPSGGSDTTGGME